MENVFNPEGTKKSEQDNLVDAVISKLESSGKLKTSPPKHQMNNNAIRFENPDGSFGQWIQFPAPSSAPANSKFGSGYFPGGSGKGSPADPNKSIQFNDNGVFGGDENWIFNKDTESVTLGTRLGNNEGLYSLSVGVDNEVSGEYSLGVGNRLDMLANMSFSVGDTNVHGANALFGVSSGSSNTLNAKNAYARGDDNYALGINSTAIGVLNNVQNLNGFAINCVDVEVVPAAGSQCGAIGMEEFNIPPDNAGTTFVEHLAIWPLKNDPIHSGRKWFQEKGQTVGGGSITLADVPLNDNELVTIEAVVHAIKTGTNESYSAIFHAAWKRSGGFVVPVNIGHNILNTHSDLAGPITNSTTAGGQGVLIIAVGNFIGDVLDWTVSYSTIYSNLGP